ncbi:hypothetical protein AGMMS49982_08990 [Bacteroidia bacterium]|nr:hypothetical protein AGMMS49982_08990 [Bacteroidia bacterium]
MKKIVSILFVALFCAGCVYPELSMDEIREKLGVSGDEEPLEKGVSIKFSKYTVVSDDNSDSIINKGETVSLRIYLKNNGTTTAKGVKATFSTEDALISGFTPTSAVTYGEIPSYATGYVYSNSGSHTIKFKVSSSASAGTQIPISISIIDESGNRWTESFNVTVEATKAQVAVSHYTVVSDNNNDSIINKGETVSLRVYLGNKGTSTAKGVKATFSTNDALVSEFTPTSAVTYGEIPSVASTGYVYTNSGSFTIKFKVSSSASAGAKIPISISIMDESGNTWTDNFDVTVEGTTAQLEYASHSIYSEDNGDGTINKGETVSLKVYLKNSGTSKALGVKATFATTSAYVSGFTPTAQITYGDIAAGSSVGGSSLANYTIRFTVSTTTPANTQIPISIDMVDASGNTWTDDFSVTVVATTAQLAYYGYSVYADSNSDGIINHGETVSLRMYLKNSGIGSTSAVKVTFSTTNSYVSGLTPTTQINYGTISAGTNKWVDYTGYSSYYTIRFAISASTPVGTQIPININMTDGFGNTWTDVCNVTVGSDDANMAYEKYTVMADYDGDKKVEAGETVYLQVFLRNIGSGAANAVKATFSSGSSYISGLSPTTQIDYGNYTGGQSKYGQGGYDFSVYYTIMFTVSNSATAGTQIPISISMVDGSSNSWTGSFNVKVE